MTGNGQTTLGAAATSRTGQAIGVGTLTAALTILGPMGFQAWKDSQDASTEILLSSFERTDEAHEEHVVSLNSAIRECLTEKREIRLSSVEQNSSLQDRLVTIQLELNTCYRDRVERTPVPPAVAAAIASQPMESPDDD